jgi:PAS domain S-box-containing protein
VLLVEDNPGDAQLILEVLRGFPADAYDLERVDRLAPALERLGRAGVDVVLLDLDLPDSDGLDTLRRAQREAPHEPILVMGLDDEGLALEAVRAGAQDYLVKGRIEGDRLARAIRYAIERKRAELTLRWLTHAVNQSPAAIFITDLSGRIEYVNTKFTEITGYTADEAIGKTPRLLKSGLTPPERYAELWAALSAGRPWRGEIQNRRKNGQLYWDAVVISPIRDTRGQVDHYLAIQEDITERKHTEEKLRASERRLRTLFETVNLVVLALDSRGHVEYVNPFFLRLTGYGEDEVFGRDWFDFVPPRDRPQLRGTFRELIERELHPHYENPILTKAGDERMISWHNTVLRDTAARAIGTLSVGDDITDRVRLEDQLRQAQKMEAVGRLAGGIAHDFNNVLTSIFGYTDLLLAESPAGPAQEDLQEIKNAATRAASLTRQLLAFSRKQVLQPAVLSLNAIVADLENMLRRLIGEDVHLRTALAPDLGNALVDPGQMEQVILNLAVNARDAMPTGGRLTIETANAQLDDTYAESHRPVTPGRYVQLTVTDTGVGMTPEVRGQIFQPFFTTKEKGKGTGLGLATVYGIVKQSGGYIWAYSEPGHGATFKIYLPRVDAPADVRAEAEEGAAPATGTETVLLAEDDDLLRPLVRGILVKLGYHVLDAPNANAALTVARDHPAAIHLLVTDVVMPGESGRQLARRLAELRPDAKVLYMSGYTDDAIVHHGMLEPGLHYLQKPFTPVALARKVRAVLDAPP